MPSSHPVILAGFAGVFVAVVAVAYLLSPMRNWLWAIVHLLSAIALAFATGNLMRIESAPTESPSLLAIWAASAASAFALGRMLESLATGAKFPFILKLAHVSLLASGVSVLVQLLWLSKEEGLWEFVVTPAVIVSLCTGMALAVRMVWQFTNHRQAKAADPIDL